MSHLNREDLKRNELGEALEAGVHFAEGHLRTILWTLGGVLLAAVAVWSAFAWRGHRSEAANAMLSEALRVGEAPVVATGARPTDPRRPSFASGAARAAAARPLFEKVVAEHGSTAAGAAARLWLADEAFGRGDRAAARTHWRAYLERAPGGALAVVAQRNLWTLDRAEGRGQEALSEIRAALEGGAEELPADILLWELAATQMVLGAPSDSAAAWRRLVEEHPGSPFAGEARRALSASEGAV